MLGPITDLLNENLTRVENLVSLYGPENRADVAFRTPTYCGVR